MYWPLWAAVALTVGCYQVGRTVGGAQ